MSRKVMRVAGKVKDHWSRRWGILLSLVLAVGAGTVFIETVLAVNATGRFELDGNAASAATDDWDRVCYQVTGNSGCGATQGTTGSNPAGVIPATGATAVSWTGDCPIGSSGFGCNNNNATIFTGGGSKDPIDINQWAWKDGAGGLPDKDNLQHAFAARYSSSPDSATCPSGTAPTCDVIFFGSDRIDNSGDAQVGFWFLQKGARLDTNKVGGGFGFKGIHQAGDLLVLSDFTNGGSAPNIAVYKWDPTCTATGKPATGGVDLKFCADANLEELVPVTAADCATSSPQEVGCGIVNTTAISTPWTTDFTDKSGNNSYLPTEFYEAGINLSLLNLSQECFSSVVAETRSSQSPTAVLKDFVLGQFAPCGATMSTTPDIGTNQQVSPGTTVHDVATVLGHGTANPPLPTGTVTFFMCSTAATSQELCTTGGTNIGTGALVDGTPPSGRATATSPAVAPTTPARYCFRAEWPGDTNYTGPFVEFGTIDLNNTADIGTECFIVRQIPTTTVTTPTNGSGVPLPQPPNTVPFGTSLFDRAVVTGTLVGGPPPGTVTFSVCNPSQVVGGVCPAGAGSQVGSPVGLSGINGFESAALSSSVAGNTAGLWCFRATYTPSGTTYTGSSDNGSANECVLVAKAPTGTVTTPHLAANGGAITGPLAVGTQVTDQAIVTGVANGGVPTGTINFFICSPSQLQPANTGLCTTGGTAAGSPAAVAGPGTNPPQSNATSNIVTASSVGKWCFRAVYVPDPTNNYLGSSDSAVSECFNVQDTTDITSAQTWLPNDSATLTAAGQTHLNGSLSFTLFQGAACTGTVLIPTQTFTLTDADPGATGLVRTTTNSTFKVSASTTVYWKVEFVSTDSNVIGKSRCNEQTQLTINNATP